MAFVGPLMGPGGDGGSKLPLDQQRKTSSSVLKNPGTRRVLQESKKGQAPKISFLSRNMVTEKDLDWLLTDSQNVLMPFQRYDLISVVHMVTPTVFMAVSHFGNERPPNGRFLAIRDALAKSIVKSKLSRPVYFRMGMCCLVERGGEYARAVIISKSQTSRGLYRCAFLDVHGVIEVHAFDIFCIPRDVNTSKLPCNLFLAKIKGVGPIKKHATQKYFDRFNCQEKLLKTVCVISETDNLNYHHIDFVLDGQWFSQMLLSRNEAESRIFFTTVGMKWRKSKARPVASDTMPTPTDVRRIVKAMVEEGAYDFPKDGSIFETSRISLIRADLYPGYDDVLKKICPQSSLIQKLVLEKTTEEDKVRSDDSERALPTEVIMGQVYKPLDDSRGLQNRVEELKTNLDVIRAGSGAETDAMFANWIMSAVTISSEPDSEWSKQLTALAEELNRNAFS